MWEKLVLLLAGQAKEVGYDVWNEQVGEDVSPELAAAVYHYYIFGELLTKDQVVGMAASGLVLLLRLPAADAALLVHRF